MVGYDMYRQGAYQQDAYRQDAYTGSISTGCVYRMHIYVRTFCTILRLSRVRITRMRMYAMYAMSRSHMYVCIRVQLDVDPAVDATFLTIFSHLTCRCPGMLCIDREGVCTRCQQ